MPENGIPISELPLEVSYRDAVEAVYGTVLDRVADKLRQRLSVLIECDKQLVLYLYKALQQRVKSDTGHAPFRLQLISGHREPAPQEGLGGSSTTRMQRTLRELQDAIFSGEPDLLLVIPHLDILTTTTQSGLSAETREAAAVLYENPDVVFLAFRDPSFEIPRVIQNVFSVRESLVGIPRDRLRHLITQREARKLATDRLNPYSLYKYLSGLNAVRCRQILAHFNQRLDYDPQTPELAQEIYREIRELTVVGDMEVPQVDLDRDIGGYAQVKTQLKTEILQLLERKDQLFSTAEATEIEQIIPKGMILYGPPGTGKTYFAKAMATCLDATLTVISGPELKSKWVGESEENLRRVFAQARKSAPALIVFDELDSFAAARGMHQGSGVEHSMVNQLLTEMDGFRSEELVFVIGTTNFADALDPALLRPGRFELTIKIPYPTAEDRREIFAIYRDKFGFTMSDDVLEHLVEKTGGFVDRQRGIRFSGDHLYAVARSLKRDQVRRGTNQPVTSEDVDAAIGGRKKTPVKLQAQEERTIAVHESGHAICAYVLPHCPTIQRITIATGEEETLGYVMQAVRQNKYVTTRSELLDDICVLLAGRAAERLLLNEVSMGAYDDLQRANELCRVMVEELGMSDTLGPRTFASQQYDLADRQGPQRAPSSDMARRIDDEMNAMLHDQAQRAEQTLRTYEAELRKLAEILVAKKTLEEAALRELFSGKTFKASPSATRRDPAP